MMQFKASASWRERQDGVELRGWGCQLHVEAETPKHVEGVGGLVIHSRVTVETWGESEHRGWGRAGG